MFITLEGLNVPASAVSASVDAELAPQIARCSGVKTDDVLSYRILKRSLDARKKPDVRILYKLEAELRDSARPKVPACARMPEPVPFEPQNPHRLSGPAIVGAGPAGLFAALTLALAGAKPVVLERGYDVVQRKKDIDAFYRTRNLNEDSNFLYGEGGAGTWSDGKLFTRIHDPHMDFVMRTFVDCGAPESILYFSHPHLGSDRLPGIIASLREKIISLGGSFLFGKTVADIIIENGVCRGVALESGEKLSAPCVLIASGHSARSLTLRLIQHGIAHRLKGFQIGMRIEHLQRFINRSQYGVPESYPALGAADYSLAMSPVNGDASTGSATFCMCPGGEIIPAVCTKGTLCTNGMSLYARSGRFANSAVITTLNGGDFASAEAAFDFLDTLERRAFAAGGGDYTAPAQSASAFLKGEPGKLPKETSYRFGRIPARLDELLPRSVAAVLRKALVRYDRLMPGFVAEGVFTGIEARVSSPVRFERDLATLASSCRSLYLGGEGAGMAGGITSAAVDGVRLAEAMLCNKF